jgi:nitrate/TMAO reductase-like tetraheme cytochrome c subunit
MTASSDHEAPENAGADEGHDHKHQRFQRHKPLTGQPRRGHPWWVTALALLGVLIVGLAVWFAPTVATSSTEYCSSCKSMEPAFASWEKSVHAEVECLSCHIEPGFLNELAWRQSEAVTIWSDYLGADEDSRNCPACVPTNESCESCHPVDELPVESNGIRMPHDVHTTSRNLDCVDCHATVSHSPTGGEPRVSMATCTMCHNGAAAPDECGLCHVDDVATGDVHPEDYLETHGELAATRLDDCLRCHHDKAAFCDACHARPPASHFTGDWRYSHSDDAESDGASCDGCHDYDTFCEQCHRVTHPAEWGDEHGAVAAKGVASCLVCHPQSMCDECHSGRRSLP